jgi:hypothetical protein
MSDRSIFFHSLMVPQIRERPAVNKHTSHRFRMEMFNHRKLNESEGKEKYCVEVWNSFAALEDLDAEVEINTAWETIWKHIEISYQLDVCYYEPKRHKPLFHGDAQSIIRSKETSQIAKWLQDPREINGIIWTTEDMTPADISGIKRRNIWKTKLMSLQRT